jgi:ATP-dependent Clp protease ATP-binding subunit ClpC
VLAIARALAAGRGDHDVTAVHIALGLLREGENGAIAVLQHRAVPPGQLRRDLERLLGPRTGRTAPEEVALPLTSGEENILDQARAWSRGQNDDHIGPEHLLMALVADETNLAAQTLARYGIDSQSVAASIQVVIHKH